MWSDLDWLVNRDLDDIEIDLKYSGDINFICNWYSEIEPAERSILSMLKETVSCWNRKMEEHTILGSLLYTEYDIKKRIWPCNINLQ